MAGVTISGLDELKAELRKFPEALQARVAKTAATKASSKLRTAMRRGAYSAPMKKGYKRTNRLRKSIRSAVGKKPQFRGKAWVALKLAPGESRVLYYYKTLEQGRKAYTGKRRGAVAGSPPLRPFWAQTWNAVRADIEAILIAETQRALALEAGKAYGRAKGKGSI